MKKINIILAMFAVLLLLSSCEETSLYIDPDPSFIIESGDVAGVYDAVTFKITGNGNRITLFTGDAGHSYINNDIGVVLKNGDTYKYMYSTAGIFKVTLLVSSFDVNGENISTLTNVIPITINGGDKGSVVKVKYDYENARIDYFADSVSGLAKDFSLKASQLTSKAQMDVENRVCYMKTYFCNRIWEEVEQWPFPPIKNDGEFRVEITTEQDINGVSVYYFDESRSKDTLLNSGQRAAFMFNVKDEKRYKEIGLSSKLKFLPGSEIIDYKVYTLSYPEIKSFTLDNVTLTGNSEIRANPTGYDKFYALVEVDSVTNLSSLVPKFSTWLPDFTVVTDDNGNVIKGDGTDAPMDFRNPVNFNVTYTNPDYPAEFNSLSSSFTVYAKNK